MIPGMQEPTLPRRHIPRSFIDIEHSAEDLIGANNPDVPSLPTRSRIQHVLLMLRDTLQTAFNSFGICRLYPRRPSFEPNKFIPSSLLARSCPIVVQGTGSEANILPPPYPFPNMTVYRLMSWMNLGSHQKSEAEVQRLVKDVLQADDFDTKHLEGFSVRRSLRELDRDEGGEKIIFPDDWIATDVTIDIPTKSNEEAPTTYTIPGFHYCPLVEVICAAFADVQASAFHLFPFKRLWKDPLDDHQERIFDELYASDAWLEAQDNIQKLPKEPNCSLERVIAGLMFFSDATHLANFGTAKAWPLYLYFGNLTKCGNTVDGSKVEHTLGEGSWVPMVNQFVNKLGSLGLDPFCMLVVDFMHECKLGTWKSLFTHLIRLLYALPGGSQLVATLDSRFHQVLTFGNGTIQKFANNTSEMKRLAARNFEDILQTFKKLSQMLRKFQRDTCAAFETMELPKERAAHQRKFAQHSEPNAISPESSGARIKQFNLATYKFHAMGDYVSTIRLFGTTDSFTTQMGELAHRALKVFYPLTSKLDFPVQLAKHERRCRVLRRVAEAGDMPPPDTHSPADASPPTSARQHHHIATSQSSPINLFAFLREHDGDPAVKNFIPKLKDHTKNTVIIPNNTIYSVHTMQIYYTTYDFRRKYDTINPRTRADVMVLSGELMPNHPYWYARVLGIYHLETWLTNGDQPTKQRLEVLWVRWLAPLRNYRSGMKYAHLPKVAFVDESDPDTFGFLDPSQVIRGAHLIPAFALERGISSLRYGKSLARPDGELDDWEAHYVGIFVDRDMFMRYTHLGVGHPAMLRRIARDCLGFEAPADAMDVVDHDADPEEVSGGEGIEEFDEEELEEGDDGEDGGGSDGDIFDDLSF
ncbi:hypothetical protein EV702DRAFT_1203702 [Suillus placidus]|uniref:Uncharacterized protein n=1 Tax=Suillus placidus TaxID=48579 RepID=A0A9P6ZJ69_9AGAM|nr:hypothetical protein EV702DRAFT_1203702 [Suillus placidus]